MKPIISTATYHREFAEIARRKLAELRRIKLDYPALDIERAEDVLSDWLGRLTHA